MKKNYLLLLIPAMPLGRWVCGILLFIVLFSFFKLTSRGAVPPASLFFALIISYIVPIFSFITEKSVIALEDLREHLDLPAHEFEKTKLSLTHSTLGKGLISPCAGFIFAFFHQFMMFGSTLNLSLNTSDSAGNIASFVGTILIWVVMNTVISVLVINARVFSQLGKHHIKIDLFQPHRLLPFARVATSSTLSLIGALALFPILFFDSDTPLSGALPGFIATAIPIFLLLAVPIWPVHRRLLKAKEEMLLQTQILIRDKTAEITIESLGQNKVEALAPLLTFQRHISQISSWPFDLGALTRLALYLIIPPLTWVGAALIEKGLDAFF